MTNNRNAALRYLEEHQPDFLEDLIDFSVIPSISTDPEQLPAMQQAAEWVAGKLQDLGATQVSVMKTAGHPVVYGEHLSAGVEAPTALIYGHYDVQPAEPLELWATEPFVPTVKGENIYGRGITDMKGQVVAGIKAVEAIVKTGELPINLKFLIEGEEEIGSPNLPRFIRENKEKLACDFAINLDTGMLAPDVPTITYALRGMAYYEIRVQGPAQDLHSGIYGGVVHNPAQALCELIAGMHDNHGRVTLPGYYDKVRSLEGEEREELSRLPTDEAFYLQQTGVPGLWGEVGYTPNERVGARPTLEVNGLYSGYTGPGAKTVLPAQAMAKISMRLVPDQDPKEVHQQLLAYMEEKAPPTIRWEVIALVGGPASISDRNSTAVQSLANALETVWGKRPVFKREGGSVPVVAQFQEILGVESVNTGFSLPGDNMHGPNEKLHLPTWSKGIQALVHYFFNLTVQT
jgi:acetylornithine deacetylase/succinyl-diaminopimelate desuccinylase-like protein